MVDNIGKIYIIKNTITDKVYIGQTIQSVERRFKKHLSDSKQSNNIFSRAIKKYGAENFYYEILESNIPLSELDEREIYWIKYFDSYNNGYNSTTGGQYYKRLYNDDFIFQILALWEEGLNTFEIAETLNIDQQTVTRYLKGSFNISQEEINQHRINNLYNYSDEELLQYWNSGLGIYQIHKKYGGNTIKQRLISLGIKEDEIDARSKEIKAEQCRINQQKKTKVFEKIYQFSLEGQYIQNYNSIKEAAENTGTQPSSISHCCNNDYNSANGYIWSYTNNLQDIQNKIDKLQKTNKRKVYQYTKDNIFVKEYESIADAARAVGLKSYSSIANILDNPNRSSKGFRWYTYILGEQ